MVIIRRFECALEETKDKVVELYKKDPKKPAVFYERESGYPFYNTSEFTLKNLLNDSDNIATNFESYINGFSASVKEILLNLDIYNQIKKLDKSNRLYTIVKKFSEVDLNPRRIDNHTMWDISLKILFIGIQKTLRLVITIHREKLFVY